MLSLLLLVLLMLMVWLVLLPLFVAAAFIAVDVVVSVVLLLARYASRHCCPLSNQRLLTCRTIAPIGGHKGPEFLVGLPRLCVGVPELWEVFFFKTSTLPLDLVMFYVIFLKISMPHITQDNPPPPKNFELICKGRGEWEHIERRAYEKNLDVLFPKTSVSLSVPPFGMEKKIARKHPPGGGGGATLPLV